MSKTKQRRVTEQRKHSGMYLKGMQDFIAHENPSTAEATGEDEVLLVGEKSPHWNNMAYRSGWYRFKKV